MATWRRVWGVVAGLTPEQYDQAIPCIYGSIRTQMTHVTQVSTGWLMGLNNQPGGQEYRLNPGDFAAAAALRVRWEEVAGETLTWVATLSDDQLDETLPGMMGLTWHVLYHLINHGTDPRALVLSGLQTLGAPTFPQDLIACLWFPPR